MAKLTEAQRRLLATVPDEWDVIPIFGDSRPRPPLLRAGLIEERQIDCTPEDWKSGGITVVRMEWRITPAGRTALEDKP